MIMIEFIPGRISGSLFSSDFNASLKEMSSLYATFNGFQKGILTGRSGFKRDNVNYLFRDGRNRGE